MNSYFEISYLRKLANVNYILIALFLAISVTSHVVAYRLVRYGGYPIIPASFIYMGAFILTDVLASYNSRRFVIFVIFLEAMVNLFFIVVTNIVIHMPAPHFLHNVSAYQAVFSPIMILYLANLLGTFVAFMIDLVIFYFLYKTQHWPFIFASLVSSLITILCYTFSTDYLAFGTIYPHFVNEITLVNITTNMINIFIYSILGQLVVLLINRYLSITKIKSSTTSA